MHTDSLSTTVDLTCVIPMYRTASVTLELLDALSRCRIPTGYRLHAIVVDDASGDDSADRVQANAPAFTSIVRQAINAGRSRARNAGAELAHPGELLFLDSDCIPADNDFIARHIDALRGGYAVSVGSVTGDGQGFWHRYQVRVAEKRSVAAARTGAALAATSPNFMIQREAYLGLSGFNERYRGYGFEDRDFFLRVHAAGLRTAWTPDAMAIHADRLQLASLCQKIREAAGAPALLFATDHPGAYRKAGYGRLDVRLHPWLRWFGPLSRMTRRLLERHGEPVLEADWIPFALRSAVVRIAVAASYLEGTTMPVTSEERRPG